MGYTLKNIKNSPFKGFNKSYISSSYGKRRFYNKQTGKYITDFHDGIDMTSGKQVIALADGVVIDCQNDIRGYSEKEASGNFVLLKHNGNHYTIYAHMKYGSVIVKKNENVKKGQVIGEKGNTGFSTGAHLHLGIKENGKWVDPVDYLIGNKNIDVASSNSYLEYAIRNGDTLCSIAQKHHTTVDTLVKLNGIENADMIYAGNSLRIPIGTTYIVKSGDTLVKIANKYNVSWKEIYLKNIEVIGDNPDKIYPGQEFII
ncbi:MAG: LysM peptidoglycan-binding domain-containing protein [Bacilli bacterium]|nr:LysM peptidoglycan-binding domain-containing protein [Bacilli bacterium]